MTPQADLDSEPWWAGLRRHELCLQRCEQCQRVRSPRMPACPYCGANGGVEVLASGRGTVYSWIRVHRLLGSTRREVPYVVATVELEEGCRAFARVVGGADIVTIGSKVSCTFEDHETWTELCCSIVAEQGKAR